MVKALVILSSMLMLLEDYTCYAQSQNDYCLEVDEVLVETFTLLKGNEQVEYMASIMKKDYVSPHTCYLFNEDRLTTELEKGEEIFADTIVSAMLLRPLKKELEGMKTMFFVPAGKLNLFAIEYCNTGDGKMLAEKYEFYRLTSSAVLAQRQSPRKPYSSYIILGGIDFDKLPDFEEKYQGCATKSRYGYLQDSYEAAKDIHHYMTEMGLHGTLFANDEATELTFKTLSWQNTQIFFIETHGIKDPRNGKGTYPDALMLAGASYLMEGGIVLDGKEDGLLTLEEIQVLDMSNVDLAVISACKSALGKIDNQGVDGLMRAFKTAGVKSLVMTTDDVVDYVSGEVWRTFFQNIVSGMSKRESLLNAIKYIRTIHDGFYRSPKYWTPFVLIDGTN